MPYNLSMPRFYTQTAFALTFALTFALSWPLTGDTNDARSLSFFHTHTRDQLEVTYFRNGNYLPGAMEQLSIFLADWRDGAQFEIDPKLMDVLWEIQRVTGHRETFEVISAYRSENTNRALRNSSKGVAQNSQHLHGKAIDVRLRGLDTRSLRDTALKLELGGVGYYERSDFVHVDTGRVRRW
jgi:uncharacterized protein YcbK (DUF882 family)